MNKEKKDIAYLMKEFDDFDTVYLFGDAMRDEAIKQLLEDAYHLGKQRAEKEKQRKVRKAYVEGTRFGVKRGRSAERRRIKEVMPTYVKCNNCGIEHSVPEVNRVMKRRL